MIYLIDNYDSFTYNIAQYLWELGAELTIRHNDEATIAEVEALSPQAILVSPGPGHPRQAGASMEILRAFLTRLPILGVCLGHQCLGEIMGARVQRALLPMHGKTSEITHDQKTVFAGLPNPMTVGRYHSLVIAEEALPKEIEVSARTKEQEIMGLRIIGTRAEGVQFHPESILTPEGKRLLQNFLLGLRA